MTSNEESTQNVQYQELLQEKKEISKGPVFGKRHCQILNISFLMFIAYYTRNCLSVAIVAMNDRNSTSNLDIPTFNWTNKNIVLSSFFIGYVPFQIIFGWLLRYVNVKSFSISAITICSILGLLTPTIANLGGSKGVIAIRVFQGVTQAFMLPLSQHLIGLWIPPNERAVSGGFVLAATPVGSLMAMLIPGLIAGSYYGWPWIFYSSNILSLIWCVSFALFSYAKPSDHPNITVGERSYIEQALGTKICLKKTPTPFKAILTSAPFWAKTLTSTGYMWCYWMQQSQIPMYLKYVMKYDIKMTGVLAASPYLLQWLCGYAFSFSSDYLLNRKLWSVTVARKFMTAIGVGVPALCFILLQNCGPEESTKAIVLLNVASAFNAACYCGHKINAVDLSPNFASVIGGIGNGLSQVMGLLAPLFAQAVINNEEDPNDWKILFYTSAGFYIVSGLIFVGFGSGNVQPWNSYGEPEDREDELRSQELTRLK